MKYTVIAIKKNRYTKDEELARVETNNLEEAKRAKRRFEGLYNYTTKIIDNETGNEVTVKRYYRTTRVYRNNYIKMY